MSKFGIETGEYILAASETQETRGESPLLKLRKGIRLRNGGNRGCRPTGGGYGYNLRRAIGFDDLIDIHRFVLNQTLCFPASIGKGEGIRGLRIRVSVRLTAPKKEGNWTLLY